VKAAKPRTNKMQKLFHQKIRTNPQKIYNRKRELVTYTNGSSGALFAAASNKK
jgi:hypothetical protein